MDRELALVVAKPYWREEDAARVARAWRASDESLAAFARRYGFRPERLRRWVSEGRTAMAAPGPSFIEVTRVVTTRGLDVAVGRAVVRVEAGFDPALLRQIVAALEASAC